MVGSSEGMSSLVNCFVGYLCPTSIAVVPLSLPKYYFMKNLDIGGTGRWVWTGGMSSLVECLGDHLCPTIIAVVPLSLPKYYFLKMFDVGGTGWWV